MSATDVIKEWKKNNPQIENIVLFISDALRWDYTPQSVSSRGVTFKTVASGIMTSASFPSIVTGLYPSHHGIYSFYGDRLPKGVDTLLNLYGHNTSIWTENTWIGYEPPTSSPLFRLLRHRNRVSLKELKPPFIYLEDERGGHCPYGWSAANKEYEPWDCQRFFRDFGRKEERVLRKKYREGIQRSVQEFESRMQLIDERGLADKTLVVFSSDHGELLGEYGGNVGHENLTAPEVVYVPTVFIHPDLPKGKKFEREGVLRHVDLYPTICNILGSRVTTRVDGVSLLDINKLPDFGFTYFLEKGRILNYELKEVSIWDKDGGYVFREGISLILRLFRTFYFTAFSNSMTAIYQRQRARSRLRKFPRMLNNYHELLECFCRSSMRYGSPSFSFKEAKFYIKELCKSTIETSEKEKIRIIVNKLKSQKKI